MLVVKELTRNADLLGKKSSAQNKCSCAFGSDETRVCISTSSVHFITDPSAQRKHHSQLTTPGRDSGVHLSAPGCVVGSWSDEVLFI